MADELLLRATNVHDPSIRHVLTAQDAHQPGDVAHAHAVGDVRSPLAGIAEVS